MSFKTHGHVPNGLGARDQNGYMVCGICGQGYDDRKRPPRLSREERRRRAGVPWHERLENRG